MDQFGNSDPRTTGISSRKTCLQLVTRTLILGASSLEDFNAMGLHEKRKSQDSNNKGKGGQFIAGQNRIGK